MAPDRRAPAGARWDALCVLEPMTSDGCMDVARACRSAGLEFMDGVARRWSTHDLVAWFVGSYHAVARSSAVHPAIPEERAPLTALMTQARGHVLRTLERHASMGGRSAFIRDLTEKGALAPTLVARQAVWIPTDHARLALRDRVMSLFAADALVRPADYESPLCPRCGALALDGHVDCPPGARLARASVRSPSPDGDRP